MKFMTCSGLPLKFFLNSGSCVAIPTGHVFRWQALIIMQPDATSGAVENPNSSAPKRHAMATSLPVFICPSHSITTLPLKSFNTRVC